MKRNIAFILTLIMLLSIIPFNVFAENSPDSQLKEAILRSKRLFNIGPDFDKFNQSISTRDGSTVFYLNWSDSQEKLGQINVSMTMDGTVMSYNSWKPVYGEEEIKLPTISKEEGLLIAKDFIEKASPKFAKNILYKETNEPLNINSNNYNYSFVRIENDIPYYNNNINITIDNSTGEVRDYYASWDVDMLFVDPKDILSLDEARKGYREKIGLDLIYKLSMDGKESNIFLVYGPLNHALGINAKDGEISPIYDYYSPYDKASGMGGMDNAVRESELSPDEEKAVEDLSGLISKEEAQSLARAILDLDKDYELRDINLRTSWINDDDYHWEMGFVNEVDDYSYYASISIDAKTKTLISFYKDSPTAPDAKAKYNREQSLKIAKDFIEKYNPENYKDIELMENPIIMDAPSDEKRYSFQFTRKIDNAYVEQDGITINVDGVNGRVVQYNFTWTNKEFPSKEDIISLEQAYDIFFNDLGLELKYTSKDRYEASTKKDKEAILVYALKNDKPANIDAKTASILDNRGKPYKPSTVVSYKDIDNSYAKDKIKILAQYGIVLDGDSFKPSEKIVQKDFLTLLAKAKYPYFEVNGSEDDLYKHLLNMNIIKEDEVSPQDFVSKEEAVKYIIRVLAYEKVANLTDIYKDIFKDSKDINPQLKGHVSIAYGLKIIQGYNGNLNPKVELKREDTANMIYNYLFSQ